MTDFLKMSDISDEKVKSYTEITPENGGNGEKPPENTVSGPTYVPPLHIFSESAAPYYAHNLPVMPLKPQDKKAIIDDWSIYHDRMPTAETQAQWIKHYPDGNIGLVLGVQSGISMIDIDTPDAELANKIVAMLPPTPWCKIGKKGLTLAYRFVGVPTFRIKNNTGVMLVEHLSSRTQTVLPPSIHPETRRPYVSNTNLWEVIDQLVPLPLDIEEKLRTMLVQQGEELSTKGYTKLGDRVSVGSRDVTLTARAGLYANLVMRGERSLVQAADELRANISALVTDVAGDAVDPEKHVSNMVVFLRRDVLERNKVLPKNWDAGLTEEQKKEMGLDFNKECIEWDYDEMVMYLKAEFEKFTPEQPGRSAAIEKVMKMMHKSKGLNSIDQDRVLNYIVNTSAMNIKMSSLRKMLRDQRDEDVKGINHAELAQAMIEEYQKVSQIKFYKDKFWMWGGSHWVEIREQEVIGRIIKEYGDLPAAKRWSDHNGIYKTMSTLCFGELAETKEYGVNFANGFLRRDMSMEPHQPEHGMTYTLPYRYDPQEAHRCTRWLEFLRTAWGDDPDYADKVEALRDVMCITMFGLGTSMQRAVLLYGVPHTGKSVVMEVMQGLMPEEARCVVPPTSWRDKFSPVAMLNKYLNTCGELDQRETISGSMFKMIVSGEEIEVQYKGRQVFNMKPTPTHWFCSNHLPRASDDTGGFTRRWLVLTFNKQYPVEKKIDRYAEVLLAEEREAICAWVMQAAPKFKKSTVPTFPKSHQEFIHEMWNVSNSVRLFLLDSGLVKGHAQAKVDEHALHARYWSYCVQSGLARPVSQKMFRSKAKEFQMDVGFNIQLEPDPKTGSDVAMYVGLQLGR